MSASRAVSMVVVYRVKAGREGEFLPLLKAHWPALSRLGLATAEPAKALRGRTKDGKTVFIETFQWANESAPGVAHQTPEVMKIWEPMGAMLEGMDLIQVEPQAL